VIGAGARTALLVAIWLLAWGEVTPGNVVTGVAVATLLLVAFPAPRPTAHPHARPRLGAILVLLGYVARQLLVSNVLVARQIVSSQSRINSGVIVHELQTTSDLVMTLVANIMALTPGTMPVEVTRDPPALSVHFLLLDDVEQARRSVAHLERLVVAATGRHDPVVATDAASPPPPTPERGA
jgi:multicomponent Na+:H+ antiporter subunit E